MKLCKGIQKQKINRKKKEEKKEKKDANLSTPTFLAMKHQTINLFFLALYVISLEAWNMAGYSSRNIM